MGRTSRKVIDKWVVLGTDLHKQTQNYLTANHGWSAARAELHNTLVKIYSYYWRLSNSLGLIHKSKYEWHNARGTGIADMAVSSYMTELYETRRSFGLPNTPNTN